MAANPWGFWKWLSQEHTAIAALGTLCATAIGLIGITLTLTRGGDGTASAQLEQQAVSIERRLGDGTEFFDVRNILVPSSEVRNRLPDSKFFSEDGFYGLDDEDLGDWEYEVSSEKEFFLLVYGDNADAATAAEQLYGEVNPPLHLWSTNPRDISIPAAPGLTEPTKLNIRDYVFVERLSHDELAEIYSLTSGEPDEGSASDDEEPLDEVVSQLEAIYRGDSAGVTLQSQLPLLLPTGDPHIRPVLDSIGKIGNVVYVQSWWEVTDATVDGEEHDKYFMDFEAMMISTKDDMWLVRSLVGTPDRLGDSYDWLDDWLLHFGIVEGA